jgi:CDP-diacylglycerol--glycerol-3-phosphate 3-phosphatidyltransferase
MAKGAWQERARRLLEPLVAGLAAAGVSPTAVTLAGLALNIVAGVVIALQHPVAGGVTLLVAGVCDALDGQLARRLGRTSHFGAFLDSTIDRIDETVVLAGIAMWFLRAGRAHAEMMVVATVLALGGSIITSYARARAEGLGLECKVGLFERPERVAVTIAGLLFGAQALTGAVLVIVVLSWTTVLQRILHVRHLTAAAAASGPARPPRPGA